MARGPEAARSGGWFAPPRPRIIAHRGLTVDPDGAAVAPENTLLAFRRALEAGATHLESDVRATADGVAVLAHDPDLERLTGRPVAIAESTLAELRAVPLGAEQSICTLAELLEEHPDTRLNLDIKAPDATIPAAAAITAAGAADRVLVTSFSGRRRRATIARIPGAATSASSGAAGLAIAGALVGIAPLTRLALRRVDALQIPVRVGPLPIASARFVAGIHRAGVEVHYWTVDDPAEMRSLLEAGADGLITDRADLASRLRS